MDLLIAASLRRLRAFLVVCETLHIGRAAQVLGIAQPALSQQIRSLEAALGLSLFNRRKRGIDLTSAGTAYREQARRLLAEHQRAAELARGIARGEFGAIAIGYVASAMFGAQFPALLGRYHAAYPQLSITLKEGGIEEIRQSLAKGLLDLALIRAPAPLPAGCTHRLARRDRLLVALAESDPAATKSALRLADLQGKAMISYNDTAEVGIERVVRDLLQEAGSELQVGWHVSAVTSLLGLVRAGLGFGIVPEGLGDISVPGICFRPLQDEQAAAELWYVWRTDHVSPALAHLIALMDEAESRRQPRRARPASR